MRLVCLFCLFLPAYSGDLPVSKFITTKNFDPIENEAITRPGSITADADGNVYALDTVLCKIFKWNKDGKYLGSIGQKGSGPGEIGLSDNLGILAIKGSQLLLYEENSIHFWRDEKGSTSSLPTYLKTHKSISKDLGGRWMDFQPLAKGFVVINANHERAETQLITLDESYKPEKELAVIKGSMYTQNQFDRWDFNPLADQLVISVQDDLIWYGNSNENKIYKINSKGQKLKTLTLPILQEELPVTELNFYRRAFERWAQKNDKLALTGKMSCFDGLLPIKNNQLCAIKIHKGDGSLNGIAVDSETGLSLTRIRQSFDDTLGFLQSVAGKVYFLICDDNGEYQLELRDLVELKETAVDRITRVANQPK